MKKGEGKDRDYWEQVRKNRCWNCNAELVTYYSESYKGRRSKCPICGVDFPVE